MAERAILSDADRARIRQAVAAAEANTSGEIFTVVAEECDDYRFIPLLWATLIALIVPLPLIFLTAWAGLGHLAGAVRGVRGPRHRLLAAGGAVRRGAAPVKREAARALAAQQFLAHGLHTTEARTGVLIFVALAEHHAEIIADTGIASQVDAGAWQPAMDRLTAEVGAGRLTEGLIAAIEASGALLARHFPGSPTTATSSPTISCCSDCRLCDGWLIRANVRGRFWPGRSSR
ncbi:MAG: hypothetical protein WDM84_00065 [Bauldia sp.]